MLADFSINDMTHTLHYLLKRLQNMQHLDATGQSAAKNADQRAGGSDGETHSKL